MQWLLWVSSEQVKTRKVIAKEVIFIWKWFSLDLFGCVCTGGGGGESGNDAWLLWLLSILVAGTFKVPSADGTGYHSQNGIHYEAWFIWVVAMPFRLENAARKFQRLRSPDGDTSRTSLHVPERAPDRRACTYPASPQTRDGHSFASFGDDGIFGPACWGCMPSSPPFTLICPVHSSHPAPSTPSPAKIARDSYLPTGSMYFVFCRLFPSSPQPPRQCLAPTCHLSSLN